MRAPVEKQVCTELLRHTLSKGMWTRLLPPGRAWMREHELLECDRASELANVLAERLRYEERWRKGFRSGEHINLKELRAYILEEAYVARSYSKVRMVSGLTLRWLWAASSALVVSDGEKSDDLLDEAAGFPKGSTSASEMSLTFLQQGPWTFTPGLVASHVLCFDMGVLGSSALTLRTRWTRIFSTLR